VLEKIKKSSLCCHPAKCTFEVEKMDFLGMVVGRGQVGISPAKVETIMKERLPMGKKAIRRFLGMANYHWRFIKDYSRIAHPSMT
jgi:hypothetical protein